MANTLLKQTLRHSEMYLPFYEFEDACEMCPEECWQYNDHPDSIGLTGRTIRVVLWLDSMQYAAWREVDGVRSDETHTGYTIKDALRSLLKEV